MILGFINQKGGVGKTTLSICVAHELSRRFTSESVLFVDADPQQSALTWSEVRKSELPFSIIGMPSKTVHRDLPRIAKNYKYVVIDSPPRVTDLARSCIAASDLVLIPCTPSPYDVWASKETLDLVKESTIYKQKLKYCFIINRKIANTAIGNDVKEALSNMEVNVLDSYVCQRVVFAETATVGMTVFDYKGDKKAIKEIVSLVDEILNLE